MFDSKQFLQNFLTRRKDRKTACELETALEALSNGHDLTSVQAQENLESSLVELVSLDRSHGANGLLLTTGGYILTCYHCTYNRVTQREIQFRAKYQGMLFPVQSVPVKARISDLAIVKVDLGRNNEPYHFKTYDEECKLWTPIAVHAVREGDLQKKHGLVDRKFFRQEYFEGENNIKVDVTHHYGLQADLAPGDSGGIAADPLGAIIGVANAGFPGHPLSIVVKISRAREMIRFGIEELSK